MADKPKATIVLMEDDAVLADMYVQKFTKEGYDIAHAYDGVEGLELVRRKKPDVVLLDIMMPKKNGIDTLRDLKADPSLSDVFVAMLSNVGDQQYIDQAMQLGARKYLMKSNFTPSEVVAKVAEWVARKGA